MLRALRKLLKPGGRTAFVTIVTPPDLTTTQRCRATRDGPPVPSSTRPIDVLMEAAGYSDVTDEDVTGEYLVTARRWHEAALANERDLRDHLGSDEFDDICKDRAAMISAIEDGLLTRRMLTGRTP